MFSQSYNPSGLRHPLQSSNSYKPPLALERRKSQEKSRRQRMIDRQRAELQQVRFMEETSNVAEEQRLIETRRWHLEGQGDPRPSHADLPAVRIIMNAISYPSLVPSHIRDILPHDQQATSDFPPRIIQVALKADDRVSTQRYHELNQCLRRCRADTDLSTIGTEEHHHRDYCGAEEHHHQDSSNGLKSLDIDEEDVSAPRHIMAVKDDSDDDDDDGLHSVWDHHLTELENCFERND